MGRPSFKILLSPFLCTCSYILNSPIEWARVKTLSILFSLCLPRFSCFVSLGAVKSASYHSELAILENGPLEVVISYIHSAYQSEQSLGESPPGLYKWEPRVQNKEPRPGVPWLLTPVIHPTGEIPNPAKALPRVLWSIWLWGDSKEGGQKLEPWHQETWIPGDSLSGLRDSRVHHPTILEVRLPWFSCPTRSQTLSSSPQWSGHCRSQRGCLLTHCSQLSQPHAGVDLGIKAAQAPGMWSSPGPQSLRGECPRHSTFVKLIFRQ